ncbi:DUF2617 family protein [Lignipirellula cremea]|uniref:DUF2617 domain-containing protein n=1 Tax=Lignipirellula cremea TaxID=2528010 RepID=A0A518E3U6_9BACT|nr:DUF2617 family protein [Lignipirellula cremea]QDU98760.1 hypothetical protein Pla8534_66330 [Lignipirellula cremea]
MLSVRPKIAELAFQVYGRSLHPELFVTLQSRTFTRGDYSAKVNITTAGHVVTWCYRGMTLTEVAASAQHPLPKKRRLLSCRLAGERQDRIKCTGGVTYKMNFHSETVDPQFFWNFQQEVLQDYSEHTMFQAFDASGRIALGALSYVNVELRNRSLSVQAFHTFPDDCAVVRTESRFALP